MVNNLNLLKIELEFCLIFGYKLYFVSQYYIFDIVFFTKFVCQKLFYINKKNY